MARKLRIQYPEAIYHVMNRGDRRERIHSDDQDRQRFLETLTETCQKTNWQIHAYCLMPNHFHFVVETPNPNLVAGMKWLLVKDTTAGRKVFADRMESRRRDPDREEFKPVERGWCLGGEEFRQELLRRVNTPAGPSHYGEAVRHAVEVRAERIVEEGLKRLEWNEAELRARRKGEPQKVGLARELRAQTTMPLSWIAERLSMGTRAYLAFLPGQRRKTKHERPEEQPVLPT